MNLTDHAGVRLTHGKPMVNGVEIHYAIGGAGEPVFLLHGVPKTMSYWRHLVPLLTPHYTVIAIDNRGAGGSQRPMTGYDTETMAGDVAELATHLGFDQFRVAGEDWGAAIAYAVAAFYRPRVQQLVFQETLLPGLPAGPGLPGGERDPTLAADAMRTGWHFSFFSLPNLPELLLAGRERPFWTYYARRQMWDPSALTEEDVDEIVHSAEQPGGNRAILEMYPALRQTDAEQNRPHYADLGSAAPVLSRRRAGLSRGRSIKTARASGSRRPRRRHPRIRSQHRAGEPGCPGPGLPRLLRRRLSDSACALMAVELLSFCVDAVIFTRSPPADVATRLGSCRSEQRSRRGLSPNTTGEETERVRKLSSPCRRVNMLRPPEGLRVLVEMQHLEVGGDHRTDYLSERPLPLHSAARGICVVHMAAAEVTAIRPDARRILIPGP